MYYMKYGVWDINHLTRYQTLRYSLCVYVCIKTHGSELCGLESKPQMNKCKALM